MSPPRSTAPRRDRPRPRPSRAPTSPPPRPPGALAAGAGAGILLALGAFVQPPDGPEWGSATADQIRAFLAEHAGELRLAALAGTAGVGLILVFVSALAALVRARVEASPLPAIVLAGGVAGSFLVFLDVAAATMPLLLPTVAPPDLVDVSDATLVGWYNFAAYTHYLSDLGLVFFVAVLFAASLASVSDGALPTWLGWAGIVIATCGAVGLVGVTMEAAVFYPLWFVGLFGWFAWIIVGSVTMGVLSWRGRAPTVESGS